VTAIRSARGAKEKKSLRIPFPDLHRLLTTSSPLLLSLARVVYPGLEEI
jgi:hypothetical protein